MARNYSGTVWRYVKLEIQSNTWSKICRDSNERKAQWVSEEHVVLSRSGDPRGIDTGSLSSQILFIQHRLTLFTTQGLNKASPRDRKRSHARKPSTGLLGIHPQHRKISSNSNASDSSEMSTLSAKVDFHADAFTDALNSILGKNNAFFSSSLIQIILKLQNIPSPKMSILSEIQTPRRV